VKTKLVRLREFLPLEQRGKGKIKKENCSKKNKKSKASNGLARIAFLEAKGAEAVRGSPTVPLRRGRACGKEETARTRRFTGNGKQLSQKKKRIGGEVRGYKGAVEKPKDTRNLDEGDAKRKAQKNAPASDGRTGERELFSERRTQDREGGGTH